VTRTMNDAFYLAATITAVFMLFILIGAFIEHMIKRGQRRPRDE
jgi:hypothetical protein